METNKAIRKFFTDFLEKHGIKETIYYLSTVIDVDSELFNDITHQSCRYNECIAESDRGTISEENKLLEINRVRQAIIHLIPKIGLNDLKDKKFKPEPYTSLDGDRRKNQKEGKILYRIPKVMTINEKYRCIVKIAFEEIDLKIKDHIGENITLESIRVSTNMEVGISDISGNDAFKIKSLREKSQFIERGYSTNWLFDITALKEGEHEIQLDVIAIVKVGNQEKRKDLSLLKVINVSTVSKPADPDDLGFEVHAKSLYIDNPMFIPIPAGASAGKAITVIGKIANSINVLYLSTLICFMGYGINKLNKAKPIPDGNDPVKKVELNLEINKKLDRDTLEVIVNGDHPPFDLFIYTEKGDSNYLDSTRLENFSSKAYNLSSLRISRDTTLYFFLRDNSENLIDSVLSVSDYPDTTIIPWVAVKPIIYCVDLQDCDSLTIRVGGRELPVSCTIKNIETGEEKFLTTITKENRIHTINFKNNSFFKNGSYEIIAVDTLKKESNCIFYLSQCRDENIVPPVVTPIVPPIIPPPVLPKLELESKPFYAEKIKDFKIKHTVGGNYPEFKIFVNGIQNGSLPTPGTHSTNYSDLNLLQRNEIIVKDKMNNQKRKLVTFKCPLEEKVKPIPLGDCVDFNQLDGCSVLYLYKEGTNAHRKMESITFNYCPLTYKMKELGIKFYKLNIDNISSTCVNEDLRKLKDNDVATYIISEKGQKHNPLLGFNYIDPVVFENAINCTIDSSKVVVGRTGKPSFLVDLKPYSTYECNFFSVDKDDHFINYLRQNKSNKYHVQINTNVNKDYCIEFIKLLGDEKINRPIFVRSEGSKSFPKYKVYLGEFDTEKEAESFRDKMEKFNFQHVFQKNKGRKSFFVYPKEK